MIIETAAVKMQAGHQQQQRTERKESLAIWNSRAESNRNTRRESVLADKLQLSDAAMASASKTRKSELDPEAELSLGDSLKMLIIQRLFKELTGQDLQLFSPQELQAGGDVITLEQPAAEPVAQSRPEANTGPGLLYQQTQTYFESESTTFNAEGIINTKDGRSISFAVSLSMERSFYLETSTRLQIGEVPKVDPLVINFDGNAAELATTSFQFDIDANGSLDQIAVLKSNSGMLALDKNQDGQVNDGSELFGAKTGNGFRELALYDEDQNNFIDEADSIYAKLRIWQRHADGSQQLIGLGEKNIGAIYLGHVTTPFQLKAEADNQSLGEIASSGIYLQESGGVGTVQQINFTV